MSWLLATVLVAATPDLPGRAEPLPKELEGVGITEKLGANLLTGLTFTDSAGAQVVVGDYFKDGKPVIVTFNYSDCPMLCSLQLNQLVKTLREMRWTAGDEFTLVTVSMDPKETPERAAATKARYVKDYGRDSANAGWHFLVGSEDNVRALADSVGFGYRYSEQRKEYLHVAAMTLLSPKAMVSRYMYGLQHSPETLRLSLVEATEGKSGSTLDKVVLYCFHYDAAAGSYVMVAQNVMRIGAGLFVAAFAAFLSVLWLRERNKKTKTGAISTMSVPNEVSR